MHTIRARQRAWARPGKRSLSPRITPPQRPVRPVAMTEAECPDATLPVLIEQAIAMLNNPAAFGAAQRERLAQVLATLLASGEDSVNDEDAFIPQSCDA